MAVPAGPPILLLLSLRAVVLGGRRSLPPLSSHRSVHGQSPDGRQSRKSSFRTRAQLIAPGSRSKDQNSNYFFQIGGIRRVEYGECDPSDLFQRFPI